MRIIIQQTWDTLDDAIDYFLTLVLDLQAYKKHPEIPSDLFLNIKPNNKKNEKLLDDGCEIFLEDL